MNFAYKLIFVALACFSAGCSTLYDGKYAHRDGWRIGTVLSLDVDAAAGQRFIDCRKIHPAHVMANADFAYVKYRLHGTHVQKMIAAIDPGMALQTGDKVYVRVKDCTKPLIKAAA